MTTASLLLPPLMQHIAHTIRSIKLNFRSFKITVQQFVGKLFSNSLPARSLVYSLAVHQSMHDIKQFKF